jgi:hypothetical protein
MPKITLKVSLPAAVLTVWGRRFHISTTHTAKEDFLPSVRAYCVAGPFEISTIPVRGGRVQLKFQLYPYRIDSLSPLLVWYSVTFCTVCVWTPLWALLIFKNKQFHSNRSFGYWHGTCFNIKYCPIRLFFRFFQLFEECSTCPVQTTVGEGERDFVGRIGEKRDPFCVFFSDRLYPQFGVRHRATESTLSKGTAIWRQFTFLF